MHRKRQERVGKIGEKEDVCNTFANYLIPSYNYSSLSHYDYFFIAFQPISSLDDLFLLISSLFYDLPFAYFTILCKLALNVRSMIYKGP